MSDYDILRQALLTIRKVIRNSGVDYEADDIYNIAVDALNATENKIIEQIPDPSTMLNYPAFEYGNDMIISPNEVNK